MAISPPSSQPTQRNKRTRPSVLSSSPDLCGLGMLLFCTFSSIFSFVITLIMLSKFLLGAWKSPAESSSGFSYSGPQCGRELYATPNFNSASKANSLGFSEKNSLATVSSSAMYWSNQMETVTDSFSHAVNRDSGERRRTAGNGCRLFGIQLLENSNLEDTSPVVTVSETVGDIQQFLSLDAESDQQSEPSNVNAADHTSVNYDAEKWSIRSLESQSRQIRSCTKVILPFLSCVFLFCKSFTFWVIWGL